ncbi:GntR family transcriptional regulator [Nitrincola sp.]|uniref:GntR family transcriptional regulator n=1 Tax=Nitrincola sp. TaxID=1926584 RepID=UPI003A8E5B56
MANGDVTSKIAKMILQELLSGDLSCGEHINANSLADHYGVSRTPIREALKELEIKSVVIRKPNRGYFIADELPRDVMDWAKTQLEESADEYQTLVNDWLEDAIPEEFTEQFIKDRYNWTKLKTTAMLSRANREGWAERKPGYGWKLLQVAKTAEAFSQIYRLRIALEPAALLEPTFQLDHKVLKELRAAQKRMLAADVGSLSNEVILSYGPNFHEELIRMSGNPYFLMALQQANRMRKLMEYKAPIDRERLEEQYSEHLEILDLLEAGNVVDASYKLRQHLVGAFARKSRAS